MYQDYKESKRIIIRIFPPKIYIKNQSINKMKIIFFRNYFLKISVLKNKLVIV